MTYLLYGIMKESAAIVNSGDITGINAVPGINENLTGIKGKPVTFVTSHGLCAAVSELDVEEKTPPVAELLAYIHVVEALHHQQAIVPMRYGCFLNGTPAIRDVLKERQRQYHTLLDELEGHVEMGIRIILSEKESHHQQGEATDRQGAPSTGGLAAQPKDEQSVNGRAYLALRKVHYKIQEEISHDRQALIDSYIQAFSGLYARHRIETDTKNDAVILSLYFLTPDSSVNRFREIFGKMVAKENDEATLSGPWPPYNFVTTDLAPADDLLLRT
jgi:hypothetical protein